MADTSVGVRWRPLWELNGCLQLNGWHANKQTKCLPAVPWLAYQQTIKSGCLQLNCWLANKQTALGGGVQVKTSGPNHERTPQEAIVFKEHMRYKNLPARCRARLPVLAVQLDCLLQGRAGRHTWNLRVDSGRKVVPNRTLGSFLTHLLYRATSK